MRLGLLGGTFDPIHLGHLRAAENAREALGLDRVLFVPAGLPPHRPAPLASSFDRFAMVALATAGHPGFVVSDLEIQRQGPSYTVDTVRRLLESAGATTLFLLIGSDLCSEIAGWKDAAQIAGLCSLGVIARPETRRDEVAAPAGFAATRVDGPGLAIAASEIRGRVAQSRSVRFLVPSGVAEHIDKRGLYR